MAEKKKHGWVMTSIRSVSSGNLHGSGAWLRRLTEPVTICYYKTPVAVVVPYDQWCKMQEAVKAAGALLRADE